MPPDPLSVIAESYRSTLAHLRLAVRLLVFHTVMLGLALLAVDGVAWQIRLMHHDMLTLHREHQALHGAILEWAAKP